MDIQGGKNPMAAWNGDNPLHEGVRFSLYLDTGDWGNRKLIVRSTVPIEGAGGCGGKVPAADGSSFTRRCLQDHLLASLLMLHLKMTANP